MRFVILSLFCVACLANAASGQGPPAKPKAPAQVEKDLSLKSVPISPQDDALLKLQKEKLNAAIGELNSAYEHHKQREAVLGNGTAVASGRLKNAVIDLNDPKVTIKTVNAYVEMMEHAHKDTEARFKTGSLAPEDYHRARYYYFDAQILQLRLKKQLEAK